MLFNNLFEKISNYTRHKDAKEIESIFEQDATNEFTFTRVYPVKIRTSKRFTEYAGIAVYDRGVYMTLPLYEKLHFPTKVLIEQNNTTKDILIEKAVEENYEFGFALKPRTNQYGVYGYSVRDNLCKVIQKGKYDYVGSDGSKVCPQITLSFRR